MGGLNKLCVVAAGVLLTLRGTAMGQDVSVSAEGSASSQTVKDDGTVVTKTTTVEITETYPAPNLGKAGTWVVGADNVAGFGWSKQIADQDVFGSDSATQFNLFGRSTTAEESQRAGSIPSAPLNGPRLTIDGFPMESLSLGGTLMFNFDDATSSTTSTAFGIAFRVGYAIGLSELIAFWPKVGIEFGYGMVEANTPLTVNDIRIVNLGLNIDAPLVFAINQQAGLTLTPSVVLPLLSQDKGIRGEIADEFVDGPKFLQVAATLGVIAWF